MKSINEVIENKGEEKLQKSRRAQVIKEIYEIYTSISEIKLRRIENWKRYCQWMRRDGLIPSRVDPENNKRFRRTELFIKEIPIGSFCFLISHIKTDDLYYILSVCKDKNNRGESSGAWLLSSIYKK